MKQQVTSTPKALSTLHHRSAASMFPKSRTVLPGWCNCSSTPAPTQQRYRSRLSSPLFRGHTLDLTDNHLRLETVGEVVTTDDKLGRLEVFAACYSRWRQVMRHLGYICAESPAGDTSKRNAKTIPCVSLPSLRITLPVLSEWARRHGGVLAPPMKLVART